MRICDICCKEIKTGGGWQIKKGEVVDYCDRCKRWLMNDYELDGNEENAKKAVREVRILMDERLENLERLQEYVKEEIGKRVDRRKWDNKK